MVAPRHLKSLQAIELALRTGSLKGAAGELGITPAAAGQRIKALEDLLGVDLMMRGRSGLQPSPALAAAAGHLSSAFRELDQAAELLELQRAHEIRVRIPGDLAALWLAPHLPRFAALYPSIGTVLVEADAEARAPDCEIGMLGGDAEPMFHDLIDAVGSPDIARRVALLPKGTELSGFPLMQHDFYSGDHAASGWTGWAGHFGLTAAGAERGIRYPSLRGAIEAACAGAGVLRCGLTLIERELGAGRLVRMLEGTSACRSDRPVAVRFRPAALARPQARRFRDWLLAEAAETRAWLTAAQGPSDKQS